MASSGGENFKLKQKKSTLYNCIFILVCTLLLTMLIPPLSAVLSNSDPFHLNIIIVTQVNFLKELSNE